jgi:hypothetical protein
MRGFYFVGWLLVTACAHPTTRLPASQSSDFEVYAAVLDSMFAPRAQSKYSRIALVESTEVFKRENTRALIESLVAVQGVDSTAARDLAFKSYEPQSLQAVTRLRLRMPVLLLGRSSLASLPREDPDKYWSEFYRRFPGTNGLISVSGIGYSADGNLGVLMVDMGCGGLCGSGYIVVVRREHGEWHIAHIQNTWIS